MVVVVLFAPLAAAGSWYWRATHRGWTVGRVEYLIRTELPKHGEREKVIAWCERHGIFIGASSSTRIYGIMSGPDVNVDLLGSGEIDIFFSFDARGRLMDYRVDGAIIGL